MTRPETVIIRHIGTWDENRHGPSFLRPLIEGVRRRLAATLVAKDFPLAAVPGGSPSRQS